MSIINYNFDGVEECASKIRGAAAAVEAEVKRLDNVIVNTQSGWQGAGAEEFIRYLSDMRKNVAERANNLYDISKRLTDSAAEAREADERAKRAAQTASAAAAVAAASQGSTGSGNPQASYTPPKTDGVCKPDPTLEMIANITKKKTDDIFSIFKKK
mgnify:CR=1 FL=1